MAGPPLLSLLLALSGAARGKATAGPVPLIIDTDMGGGGCMDVDDVGAVCLANALADRGEVELLAVVHNTGPRQCAGAISVLNHHYGRDHVPIGAYKGADLKPSAPHKYVTDIVGRWPSPVKDSSQVPSGAEVYRRVLAAQPDRSVVISSIGLLTNLAALLRSEPDEHSSLSGPELVARKVRLLAVMGGKYPGSGGSGPECNFCGGPGQDHATGAAASAYVFSHIPPTVRVIFSGFAVGLQVLTGAALSTCAHSCNPCRQAYLDYSGYVRNRQSWDPLTTLVAVRGAAAAGCVECTDCHGTNGINGVTGDNAWIRGPASNQTYLVLRDARAAATAIDGLLCQPPVQPSADSCEELS